MRREARGVEQPALVVGEHRPETPQGLRGNPRAQLRYIALKISPYVVAPPLQAAAVVGGEQTLRETSPGPERFGLAGRDLSGIDRTEFQVPDPASEGFARLAEQIQASRSASTLTMHTTL